MIRPLFLSALFLAAPLAGQAARVTRYGSPCPAGAWTFATYGQPRIGTSLLVLGIHWGSCGLLTCVGPYFLIFGTSRSNGTVSLPGVLGNGCTILARPDVILLGDAAGNVYLQIPNDARFLGLRFYLQGVGLYSIRSVGVRRVDFSDGVECVIGI